MLTKRDIAAIAQANYLAVSIGYDSGTYARLVKEVRASDKVPFPQDLEHTLDVPVAIGAYSRGDTRAAKAFVRVHLSLAARGPIHLLRSGDTVRFYFRADNNNPLLEAARLHHDDLLMFVQRGKHEYQFVLESRTSLDNSARMIKDIEYSRQEVAG